MIWLILVGLIGAAILYGIFFLFFKLIWILFKKQRNFWPLILAGVATVLLLAGTVWATVYTLNKFLQPFTPIIEAVQSRTEPVYGAYPYADTRYPFSLTLYDGTVLSDWIDVENISFKVGFDTNVFFYESDEEDGFFPFTFYAIARQAKELSLDTAMDLLQEITTGLEQAEFEGEVDLGPIASVYAGPNTTAAQVSGNFYPPGTADNLAFTLLVAKQADTVYYVVGGSNMPPEEMYQTVESFRLQNPQPAAADTPAPTLP